MTVMLAAMSIAAGAATFADEPSPLRRLAAALGERSSALADLTARAEGAPPPGADVRFLDQPLTKADAAAARQMIWEAHVAAIRRDRAKEVADRMLADGKLAMPFFLKTFGAKPKNGRSLWISLHGGGGAPKKVNDQQYRNQQRLYTLDEGIYLAPRAPTDNWNLWHEPHIDRLFARLIEDLVVLEDVDPDRVYVLGYSAGGDGVYQLAPRLADTWAAAAMMAGHPNGVSPLSLRNVPFALQVGADDTAFNRHQVAKEFGARLDELEKGDPGGYRHFVRVRPGLGHWMKLEDKEALPWMAGFTRNPVPDRVVWRQTGVPHDRLYWLAVPAPPSGAAGAMLDSVVIARRGGQAVVVEKAEGAPRLLVRFDDRMADLDKPVTIAGPDGRLLHQGVVARTIGTLLRTLARRGDPKLMFDAEAAVNLSG